MPDCAHCCNHKLYVRNRVQWRQRPWWLKRSDRSNNKEIERARPCGVTNSPLAPAELLLHCIPWFFVAAILVPVEHQRVADHCMDMTHVHYVVSRHFSAHKFISSTLMADHAKFGVLIDIFSTYEDVRGVVPGT
jgi:hypothetical protein